MEKFLIRLAKDAEGRDVLFNMTYHGTWPPPEVLEPFGEGWGKWRRETFSHLPDGFSEHIMRGAVYTYIEDSVE